MCHITRDSYRDEYDECHERYSDKSELEDTIVVCTSWEESSDRAGEWYELTEYPSTEMIIIVISCEKYTQARKNTDNHMIRTSLVVEWYEHYDVNRKHKYPLPPTERTYLELVVELICEGSYGREYRQESYELEESRIRDILDFCSDLGTEYISYEYNESNTTESEYCNGEQEWIEFKSHEED